MRFSVSAILILVTLAVFGPLPALAQGSAAEDQASEMPDVVVEADPLDRLYDRLKRTSDARQAADLARQIDE